MKPKTYNYKNISILLIPTHDEVSGMKLFQILPACSVYKMSKNYGITVCWLMFEFIINYETN